MTVRRLELVEMAAAAAVRRAAYHDRLPWLAGRHTLDEDQRLFRERVFETCEVWGALEGATLLGIVAFREDWIDQLYVAPNFQRRGVGTALLDVAKAGFPRLHAWTFQRNWPARRFYQARGFTVLKETEGDNEEGEPDILYVWSRDAERGRTA